MNTGVADQLPSQSEVRVLLVPDVSYLRFLGRLTGVKEQGRCWDYDN